MARHPPASWQFRRLSSHSTAPAASASGSDDDSSRSDTSLTDEVNQEDDSSEVDEDDPENIQISQQRASAKEKPRQATHIVRSLQLDVSDGKLIPQPFFQRGYVWSHAQASGVIETLLLGNPLPEIIIYEKVEEFTEEDGEEDSRTVMLVVDGQQRLTSIINFVTNKRADNKGWSKKQKEIEKGFYLSGLKHMPEFNGKRFDELKNKSKEMILDAQITMKVIPSSWEMDQLLVYFVAIQKNGVNMNSSQLLFAMNYGPFTELIETLSKSDDMKAIWPDEKYRPAAEKMKEQELLMRFFAAKEGKDEFTRCKNMVMLQQEIAKDLNKTMQQEQKANSNKKKQELTKQFKDAMALALEIWPPSKAGGECPGPFRKAARKEKQKLWEASNPLESVDNNVFDYQMFICSGTFINPEDLRKHKKEIFDMCMELQSSDPAFKSLSHKLHGDRIKRIEGELIKIMKIEDEPPSYSGGRADGRRSFTDQEKRRMYDKLAREGRLVCTLCGEPLPAQYDSEEMHMDHRFPYIRGGPTSPDNAQLVHARCNLKKGSRIIIRATD